MTELTTTKWSIQEREDYTLALVVDDEVLHLWHVTGTEIIGGRLANSISIYVLASNEKRAIAQAGCIDKNIVLEWTVVQIPLMVQGWANNCF